MQTQQTRPSSMPMAMQMPMPSTFMMLDEPIVPMMGMSMMDGGQTLPMMDMQLEPSNVGSSRPQSFAPSPIQPQAMPAPSAGSNVSESQPTTLMLPSMTMTILSEPGGSSNIELSTSMSPNPVSNGSLPLRSRPSSEHSDEPGGDQYYNSPWRAKAPMATLTKLNRGERLRAPVSNGPVPAQQPARNQMSVNLIGGQRSPTAPMVIIKNQWRPNKPAPAQLMQQPAQQQQVESVPDYDELVAVGPPQMMHVYQSPNGELHAAPQMATSSPGSALESEREAGWLPATRSPNELSGEVNTVTRAPALELASQVRELGKTSGGQSGLGPGRLISPVVKGKQRQAERQQEKRRPGKAASGGY